MRCDILLLPCLYLGYVFYRKIYCVVVMCIMGKYILEALCLLWGNILFRCYVFYRKIYCVVVMCFMEKYFYWAAMHIIGKYIVLGLCVLLEKISFITKSFNRRDLFLDFMTWILEVRRNLVIFSFKEDNFSEKGAV